MTACARCDCPERDHETVEYRGDKPRACLRCRQCKGFTTRARMMTVYVGTRMDTENEGKVTIVAVSTARLVVIEAIKADIDKDISDNPDDDAVESLAILDEPFDPAVGDWSAHGGLTVWQIAECKVIE